EISEDERIHRVKRQCGCCSCYGSRTSSCSCSSLCSCAPNNYASGYGNIGYGGINFNTGYGFGFNSGYPYSIYGLYNPANYGTNYNTGNGCSFGGTMSSTGCGGTGNMLPYNFGSSYGGNFITGNTGNVYPQVTGCLTGFNNGCRCENGYSPCSNGASCCRNNINGSMIR
ncbi:unnamed protein product, partial [Acanthocheilonema viteae]